MCVIVSASISLTYHMVIIIMIPLVIAGMYTSKRISVYTFILTIISIVLSTYGGYYFGIFDVITASLLFAYDITILKYCLNTKV